MPPRGRRAAAAPDMSKTLVLGIVGVGVIDTAEVDAMMEDLLKAPNADKAEIVFTLVNEDLGDGAYDAWAFAEQNANDDLTLAAVTDPSGGTEDAALHEQAVEAKARIIPVGDGSAVSVADELVKAKASGADARLIVFWITEEDGFDGDTGGQYAAIETAALGGVPAFNACNGLDDINLGEPAAEEAPAPEPEPEPEAPKRRGRPRATATEAAQEAETLVAAAAASEPEEPPRRRRGAAAKAAEPVGEEAQASVEVMGASMFSLFAKEVAAEIVRLLNPEDAPARR